MAPLRALLVLVACVFLLSACARNPVVQLYDGEPRADDQIMTVRVPSQIEVYSINGSKVSGVNSFFNAGDKDLKLLPGRYEIIAYYKELWDLDANNHEVLKSDPTKFIVNGKAGQLYRVDYDRPQNADQARTLEANFKGWVEEVNSGEKIPSQNSGLVLDRGILAPLTGSEVKPADNTPKPGTAIAPQQATQAASESASTSQSVAPAASYLDTLKAQWHQATPAERREFLQWISE